MESAFEIEKNRRSFIYTTIICAILLLLAILIRWQIAIPPIPAVQDLIEINLGNEQEGYGKEQPLIKGAMSPTPSQQEAEEDQARATTSSDAPSKDIDADESDDKEAAPVAKTVKPNPKATTITKQPVTKKIATNPTPTTKPEPKPKKPLFAYNGPGNGKGNGATEDNGYRNQGNNPNGRGDAGSPSGKPDSYGNSPGGRSGVGISSGLKGRKITQFPSFQDEFNENAKVYVDVTVNGNGGVTGASIAKGTTTSNSAIRNIALQKARQLKFNPGEEDRGTIIFNFKVQN